MMPFKVGQLFAGRISVGGAQSLASPKRLQFAADCFEAAAKVLPSMGVRHAHCPALVMRGAGTLRHELAGPMIDRYLHAARYDRDAEEHAHEVAN
jgi:hypothetical protein